ncbi:MAG: hypothetical protein JO133_09100 [Burkholderiaceae bacterium]|nr:hypothetical protein [Burkholderiaceae bacterium]
MKTIALGLVLGIVMWAGFASADDGSAATATPVQQPPAAKKADATDSDSLEAAKVAFAACAVKNRGKLEACEAERNAMLRQVDPAAPVVKESD